MGSLLPIVMKVNENERDFVPKNKKEEEVIPPKRKKN